MDWILTVVKYDIL